MERTRVTRARLMEAAAPEPVDRRTVSEAEMSFGDVERLLYSAVRKDEGGAEAAPDGPYICEVYDDFVIVSEAGKYYRRSYSIVDGEVTLGAATEVQREENYVPVKEAEIEEADYSAKERAALAKKGQAMPDGSYPIVTVADLENAIQAIGRAKNGAAVKAFIIKRAKALKATDRLPDGWLSESVGERESAGGSVLLAEADRKGNTFDVLVIQPGVSKNGRRYRKPVLQESVPLLDGARSFASEGPDHDPRRRGVKSLVGWWSDPRYEENVKLPNGKVAEGVVARYHVTDRALADTLRESLEGGKPDLITFSIVADGEVARVREGTRALVDVQRITAYESVDPVINAAAGGMAVRLVASVENPTMEWAKLTLAEAVKGLVDGTITADELKANRADLAEAIDKGAIAPAAPKTEEKKTEVAPAAQVDADEIKRLVAEGIAEAMKPAKTREIVEAKLADRPKLPEKVKSRIREAAKDRVLDEGEVDKLIEAEVEYVKGFAPAVVTEAGEAHIEGGKSERERIAEAMYDIFSGKSNDSFKGLYVELTGDRSFTGQVQKGSKLSEAIDSTTFADVLGDSITRRMLEVYQLPDLGSWRSIASVVPLSDFRTQHRVRLGGYGNLPAVAEGAPYGPLTSPDDEEATYKASKYGGTEVITMETIVNDDLGAIRQIPVRLGRATAQTLHEFVFDFLASNAVIYDTVALFAAGHNNLGSAALSASALIAGRTAMRKQTDMSSGKKLAIKPRYLIVPVDLDQTAYELLATDREVGTPNNTVNFVRTFNLDPIVVDYWTDTNNWFLAADPGLVPTIEVGFLNGRQDPELFLQDQPTIGSVFSNDKLTYKIRHIYGGAVMDFRGLYGAIVA